jgi:hypothetical protein
VYPAHPKLAALMWSLPMTPQTTAELLEAWRKAQRASDAAHQTAELAKHAAEAAAEAAEAARTVAESAGLTLDQTDAATSAAKDAYSEREHQAARTGNSEHRAVTHSPEA